MQNKLIWCLTFKTIKMGLKDVKQVNLSLFCKCGQQRTKHKIIKKNIYLYRLNRIINLFVPFIVTFPAVA